jgi:NADH oxidase (H2O2-forming)
VVLLFYLFASQTMHVVIVGNGIAGITAARHIRKQSDAHITVVSKETDHFFSRTALMYIFMGHLKYEHTKPYEDWFWQKNKIELVRATVENIDFEQKNLHLSDDAYAVSTKNTVEKNLAYDVLVLAVGSAYRTMPNILPTLKGVQGLYSYQDLTLLEQNVKDVKQAVIVGGGLIGVELAEMLHTRHIDVTMFIRESSYWNTVLPREESALITRHLQAHGLTVLPNTELDKITEDSNGRVKAVVTKTGEIIDCQFLGLTIGVEANVGFLKKMAPNLLKINRGILVDEFLRTNLPDVYAIGDCTEQLAPRPGRRAIEQIWYTGRIMGETVARTICGRPTAYQPGVFFNSAKFFDLEYQTYGDVPAQLPDGINTFYWEHPKGQLSLRINYNAQNKAVTGFNVVGIRLRHAVCEAWIKNQQTIDYVLAHLKEANFDPEFFKRYEREILNYYKTIA